MSIFKKLKEVFILEEDQQNKDVQSTQETEISQETTTSEAASSVDMPIDDTTPIAPTTSGKPDPKFVDILLKAIEKNNVEGFDYLEYKSSLQSLAKMDMDETTRYKSALAMAKTMGATPDNLIASATRYLDVLKAENVKFKAALKGQKAKNVTGREGEIKAISTDIEKKKKQIAQLQKEIEIATKKQETLKADINKSAAKVQATSDNFNRALSIVAGQIQTDIDKMKQHLT